MQLERKRESARGSGVGEGGEGGKRREGGGGREGKGGGRSGREGEGESIHNITSIPDILISYNRDIKQSICVF